MHGGEEDGAVRRRRYPLSALSPALLVDGPCAQGTPSHGGVKGYHSTGTFPTGDAWGSRQEPTSGSNVQGQHLAAVHPRQGCLRRCRAAVRPPEADSSAALSARAARSRMHPGVYDGLPSLSLVYSRLLVSLPWIEELTLRRGSSAPRGLRLRLSPRTTLAPDGGHRADFWL